MVDACLKYESQFFVETFNESFLLIASKGLCVERFFLKHLHLYSDPSVLVLVVNANKMDQEYFCQCLIESGQPLPKRLTSETSTVERRGLYLEGGVQFATTTILISDLLSDRIPLNLVTGILVYRAHSVLKSALESFILLMFRKKKADGFIKAFSDSPSSFVRSFGQLQRAVNMLRIKRVRFLPRYHVEVVDGLDKFRPNLVEFDVKMTSSMKTCQNCLIELIRVCVQELKRCQLPFEEDLTVEQAVTPWFEEKLRRKLQSNTDRVSEKVNQLLTDVGRLGQLLSSLEMDDGKTFAKSLEAIKKNPKEFRNNCGWLFTSTAEKLFDVGIKREDEVPTKWRALKTALIEIAAAEADGRVAIVASDDKLCNQIKDLILTTNTNGDKDQAWLPPGSSSLGFGSDAESLFKDSNKFRVILLSSADRLDILRTLHSFQPSAVIIFNVDIWLIRQLETYNAVRMDDVQSPIKVYFLMYRNSAEEQRYLTSLKQERESFEQLFKEETNLLIRKDDDDPSCWSNPNEKSDKNQTTTIIVDLREFRSELPTLLHVRDLNLVPATLIVGDYVLSPEICVERKSTPDLIGSLQSGRLFSQCKSMCNYYNRPFVLIELDNSKKCWRRVGDQCSAKMAVLSMNFPQVRFVWAASPSSAADLLVDFKWKREEPEIDRAIECGKESKDRTDDESKPLRVEQMVRRLPGIAPKSVDAFIKRNFSLRELCKLDEDRLEAQLDSSNSAKIMFHFLQKDFRISNNIETDKSNRKRK